MILVSKISLHVTIGLIWLRCLFQKVYVRTIGYKFQTYCHISIGLFMSTHIALSLNKILLALSIA